MKLTWLGHSSFLIETASKTLIITDPYDDTVGYKVYEGNVDIATISHHHFDHDNVKNLKGNFTTVETLGEVKIKEVAITGIQSFHDKLNGAKRGSNIIYIIEADGYRVCHLGDLGHTLDNSTLSRIGEVDILLIPVGGNFTIDGKEAAMVAKSINSHIVIPMHYKTACLAFPLDGVEGFITSMKNAENLHCSNIEFTEPLKQQNQVKILNPQAI